MASPLVLSEDEALEIIALLVTAARTQLDESAEYAPLRMLAAVGRLAGFIAERAFFPSVPHPVAGPVQITASPYHIDGEPVHPRGPAAYRVGEHTREVLSGVLGYDADRIAGLLRAGVIEAP